jgi:hypothetical protein
MDHERPSCRGCDHLAEKNARLVVSIRKLALYVHNLHPPLPSGQSRSMTRAEAMALFGNDMPGVAEWWKCVDPICRCFRDMLMEHIKVQQEPHELSANTR